MMARRARVHRFGECAQFLVRAIFPNGIPIRRAKIICDQNGMGFFPPYSTWYRDRLMRDAQNIIQMLSDIIEELND